MNRRSLLNTVAVGAVLCTTGCVGRGDQETTPTEANGSSNTTDANGNSTTGESDGSSTGDSSESRMVSVVKRVESQSGLQRVVRVADGGSLEYELTCPDGSRKTASGSVRADEWAALKERVVSLDRDRIQESYECSSGCPQDIPPKQIEMTVNGSTVSTTIEVSATIPTDLEEIVSKVETFEEQLEKPTCG